MRKLKFSILIFLFASIAFFIYRSRKKSFGYMVVDYFTTVDRSKNDILDKLSEKAIVSLIPEPTNDSAKKVISFFNSLKGDSNFDISHKADTIYIEYNPNDPLGGGPYFEIIKRENFWKIIDIRFGK